MGGGVLPPPGGEAGCRGVRDGAAAGGYVTGGKGRGEKALAAGGGGRMPGPWRRWSPILGQPGPVRRPGGGAGVPAPGEDRLEQTGKRWKVAGVRPLLYVRATCLNKN